MGKRVHVIKKHAEYGDYSAFNWKFEDFCEMLSDLGCDMCHNDYDYDDFECLVSEYETALSLVKLYKEKGKCEEVEKAFDEANSDVESFESYLEMLGGIDEVLSSMEIFYKERDKKYDWISFSAF